MGKQWKQWLTLFFWAPKSLQMVIAAMKLKDTYSLKWQPTPVLLAGESYGGRSLLGYSPWGHKESDTTERLTYIHRLVIAFLPRNKHLLISWLQSPSAVILKPPKIKSLHVSIVSPSICHEVMGLDAKILVFWMSSFKPTFSLSSFTFIKRLFSSSFLP